MPIQQYCVGGCVRDVLLAVPPHDIDYVWVGATPEHLEALGFKQVGLSFPVFLDHDGNEHALARTERKTGVGYSGFDVDFDPSVTIEEDLFRRDLTMNAMAVRIEDWNMFKQTQGHSSWLLDPFNGAHDIKACTVRHVSEHFAEDPIRVLRACRLAARYDFNIAADTLVLMRKVVHELEHVPGERIWQEFAKGLAQDSIHLPSMYHYLGMVGAFDVEQVHPYAPRVEETVFDVSQPFSAEFTLEQRFAMTGRHMPRDFLKSPFIPSSVARLTLMAWSSYEEIKGYRELSNANKIALMEKLRAFSHRETAIAAVQVIDAVSTNYVEPHFNIEFSMAADVDAAAIRESLGPKATGLDIRKAIVEARIAALP